ncbi:MAG: hypothetical protein A3J76_06145 [Candidatus Moranbacteria bacterium RBG_13_45_13]|nr:MAG: hypothetical protein A3J76_06145 [Candidatus Moranbacteria bacterium RBG_13_45_13]
MFQLTNSDSGAAKSDISNTAPNLQNRVRTFKDDMGNFEKGNPRDNFFPDVPAKTGAPANPFQSVPMPPPLHSEPTAPIAEKNTPIGLPPQKPPVSGPPSQSFFAEKPVSPFSEINSSDIKSEASPAPKRKSKLAVFTIILIILLAAAGGSYYYWFFLKNNSAATPSDSTSQAPSTQTSSESTSDAQNKRMRRLVIDTAQNPSAIKSAVHKFADEFSSTASENDLIEVKLLDKENKPIGKKDFISGFAATFPESISGKLSEDYSLFLKKEGYAVRLGLVFKTVTSANLTTEMRNWEPKIADNLNSLFLDQVSATGMVSFNSTQYKSADIRYFNFSSPATSLDYSIVSNFLIIGTSKDSMWSILDYMSEK